MARRIQSMIFAIESLAKSFKLVLQPNTLFNKDYPMGLLLINHCDGICRIYIYIYGYILVMVQSNTIKSLCSPHLWRDMSCTCRILQSLAGSRQPLPVILRNMTSRLCLMQNICRRGRKQPFHVLRVVRCDLHLDHHELMHPRTFRYSGINPAVWRVKALSRGY